MEIEDHEKRIPAEVENLKKCMFAVNDKDGAGAL